MATKKPQFLIKDDEGAYHSATDEKDLASAIYNLQRQGASVEVFERREVQIDVKVSVKRT